MEKTKEEIPEEIALDFSEIFQNNYPKKPLWQMMVDLEKRIKEYGKLQYSKGFEEGVKSRVVNEQEVIDAYLKSCGDHYPKKKKIKL